MGTLPAGLLVRGSAEQIDRCFPLLSALQPVGRDRRGLICAPRCAPELAGPAMARCPLPGEPLDRVPGWPDPPSDHIAGWYRRSPFHLPAPAGQRELVQAAGEGFGPAGHATTAMCLRALDHLPAGPALDAGCGSGLLAQAWASLGRGPVVAIDLDARAIAQARRSIAAAGAMEPVEFRRAAIGALGPDLLDDRVLLANVPPQAHRALLAIGATPRAAVLSGLRPDQTAPVVRGWRERGLMVRETEDDGRFCCLRMERA